MGRGKKYFTSHAGGSAAKKFPRTLKSEPARRQIGRTPLSIVDNKFISPG